MDEGTPQAIGSQGRRASQKAPLNAGRNARAGAAITDDWAHTETMLSGQVSDEPVCTLHNGCICELGERLRSASGPTTPTYHYYAHDRCPTGIPSFTND
jgi:hypothetical protein